MPIAVDEVPLKSWDEFVAQTRALQGRWHFRGALQHHHLQSSLERAAENWSIRLSDLPELERRMIREFKRAFPATSQIKPPALKDDLDWLALMQHYGAPTRLLDFSYSSFVAAFFALEMLMKSPPNKSYQAAVWALSIDPVDNEVIEKLVPAGVLREHFTKFSQQRGGEHFRPVFLEAKPPVQLVTPINPYKLHERLIVQQGLFICPGDVSRSFGDNLKAVPRALDWSNLKKFVLPRSVLADGMKSLGQMNIGAATLFPGVDGFARSLCHRMEFLHNVPLFPGTDY